MILFPCLSSKDDDNVRGQAVARNLLNLFLMRRANVQSTAPRSSTLSMPESGTASAGTFYSITRRTLMYTVNRKHSQGRVLLGSALLLLGSTLAFAKPVVPSTHAVDKPAELTVFIPSNGDLDAGSFASAAGISPSPSIDAKRVETFQQREGFESSYFLRAVRSANPTAYQVMVDEYQIAQTATTNRLLMQLLTTQRALLSAMQTALSSLKCDNPTQFSSACFSKIFSR